MDVTVDRYLKDIKLFREEETLRWDDLWRRLKLAFPSIKKMWIVYLFWRKQRLEFDELNQHLYRNKEGRATQKDWIETAKAIRKQRRK